MSSHARPAAPHARPKAPRSGPRRNAWGTVSRADIIDAAARTVRAGGYEQMSIRSLAAELGVAPMSLYRHIREKDDLPGEVVDRLLASAWRPSCPAGVDDEMAGRAYGALHTYSIGFAALEASRSRWWPGSWPCAAPCLAS